MIRRPPRSTQSRSSAASDVYKRQVMKSYAGFADRDLFTAAGDLDGDGHHDLVARDPDTGQLHAYLGTGAGGFTRQRVPGEWSGYSLLAATGDLDGDGKADLLARGAKGALWAMRGTGNAGFGACLLYTSDAADD